MRIDKTRVNEAKVIQAIETKIERGTGEEGDYKRVVTQYWDATSGKFLAEFDPILELSECNVHYRIMREVVDAVSSSCEELLRRSRSRAHKK